LNYCYNSSWQSSTTDDVRRYARLAGALSAVFRKHVGPALQVIVTAFVNATVLAEMRSIGADMQRVSQTSHYPFARWPHSPKGVDESTAAGMNLSDFVSTGVGFKLNTVINAPIVEAAGSALTSTETSTFKYKWGWDRYVISASLGGALQFARDWGELTYETPETMTVRHDLESPWFGHVFWSVLFDAKARGYSWMRPGWREQPHATAAERQRLRAEYFEPALQAGTDPFGVEPADVHERVWLRTPTAMAMRWLARCGALGSTALNVTPGREPLLAIRTPGRNCSWGPSSKYLLL
jgi:hypothetical protein